MAGKHNKLLCLPLMLVMQASFASDKVEFDFHNHSQSDNSHNQISETKNGIRIEVSGSDELYQNSNGLGIGDGELDAKDGHSDVMNFQFFDAKTKLPLNVLIKNLRVKMFEPKVANDSASLSQIDGGVLPSLNNSLKFQGSAGFGKDRHTSNSWSLQQDVKVLSGFSIKPNSQSGFYVYSIEVERLNMPAEFTSMPLIKTPEGQPYTYQITLADEDLESVKLSLTQAPEGMKFDPVTATLNWLPGFKAQGLYPVELSANDSEGHISKQKFTLEVINSNQVPVFVSKPVLNGKENLPYKYTFKTQDKDLDAVFLKLVNGPKGMTLDEETKTINWTPNFYDAGIHKVNIAVSDVFDESLQSFDINISDNNRFPRITSSAPDDIDEGETYQYKVSASDPDADPLQYTLVNAPKGMNIDANTGLLNWKVDYQQAGQHAIAVQVNDGKKGQHVQHFEIDVDNINRAPKIVSQAVIQTKENSPYRYRILVQDSDLDGITLTLDDGPDGMKLDPASNSLYWSPGFEEQGDYDVVIIATDGEDKAKQHFNLNVSHVNRNPVMEMVKTQNINEGEKLVLQLHADDLDNSEVNFVLTQAPKGMVMSSDDAQIHWQPNFDQAGNHQVRIKAVDSDFGEDEVQFLINVKNVNRKPEIDSQADSIASENQHYFYHFSAQDKDQDILRYKILSAPKGMKINSKNGYLNWKPTYKDAGKYTIALSVSDGFSEVKQSFALTVNNTNRDPGITSKAVLQGIENKPYQYSLTGQDADGDKLRYSLLAFPTGMTLNNKTQTLNWTPDWHQAGFHQVVVQVDDGHDGRAKQFFNLEVKNLNRAPTMNSVALESVFEKQQYQYQLTAQDADDDRLKFKLLSGPTGMTFDPYTHTLTWLPSFRSAGKHPVKVSVSDGKKEIKQSFTIRVSDQNRSPKINSVAKVILSEGQKYEYKVKASDLDTDTLSYSLLMAPKNMEINERTGQIVWNSNYEDAGQHGIEILVDDEKGGSAVQAYRLFVKNVNRKPEFISSPVTKAVIKQTYRYQLLAKDADWNILNYKLIKAPKDMILDTDTDTLYWEADKVLGGSHKVVVELSDGDTRLQQEFTVQVKSINDMSSDIANN